MEEELSTKWARELVDTLNVQNKSIRDCTSLFENHPSFTLKNCSTQELTLLVKRVCSNISMIELIQYSSHGHKANIYYGACSRRKLNPITQDINIRRQTSNKCNCPAKFSIDKNTGSLRFISGHNDECLSRLDPNIASKSYQTGCLISPAKITKAVKEVAQLKVNDPSLANNALMKQVKVEGIDISYAVQKSIVRQALDEVNSNVKMIDSFQELVRILKEEEIKYEILAPDNIIQAISFSDHAYAPTSEDTLTLLMSDVTHGIVYAQCGVIKTSMWTAFIEGEMKPLGN